MPGETHTQSLVKISVAQRLQEASEGLPHRSPGGRLEARWPGGEAEALTEVLREVLLSFSQHCRKAQGRGGS